MRAFAWHVFGALFSAWLLALPAQAIDCAKARTPVETAICSDPTLVKQDARLASLYFESLKKADTSKLGAGHATLHDALQGDQRTWLSERDKVCGTASPDRMRACVSDTINQRIAALNAVAHSGKEGTLTVGTATLVVGTNQEMHKVLEYQGKVLAEAYFPDVEPPFTVLARWSGPTGAGILLEAGEAASLQCSTISLIATSETGLTGHELGLRCVGFDEIVTKATDHGLAFIPPVAPGEDAEEVDWDGQNNQTTTHLINFSPEPGTTMRGLTADARAHHREPLKIKEFYDAVREVPEPDRKRLLVALWQVGGDCSECRDDAGREHYGMTIEPDGAIYSGCGLFMHGGVLKCGENDALAVWEKSSGRFFFALMPHREKGDPFPAAWTTTFPATAQWTPFAKSKLELWRNGAAWIKREQ
ncbi:lysozyme inhibitor LprI family protein [Bradyrhizobium sp. HKCCYLS1011]|uniref:lysozyme inhibitor LprI family protein n=1 Tax=Bradyrhizobium sp. HKCCYLS1011 TaxID=3420733 RepID=UPI003EB8FCBB